MVPMAALRELAAGLGLGDPRTLLQSGNLVFDSRVTSAARLEQLLEKETAARLGVETTYFVRTAAEWREAIAANPFPAEAKSDPSHLLVVFCRVAPLAAAVKTLQAAIVGRERVLTSGREAFVVYPDGVGVSKLTPAMTERAFTTKCTARNWNTVMKIAAALDA